MDSKPVFTIDLEDWNDALHIPDEGHSSIKAAEWLFTILDRYGVRAVVYKLEHCTFHSTKHVIKSHGKYHRWWEIADRRPYQWLGLTGGFWFRLLPLWFIKIQVKKHGLFYIHPHDLDEEHPKLRNPFLNFKRHIGLKKSRSKLERLLKEVSFCEP